MVTQSVAGISCRLNAALSRAITDHVVRVGGGFTSEVSGVEFLEGGVDVVGVERYERCDPIFGVDLDEL